MASALIVEVLDRRQQLVARYRLTDGQATIGRAFDNDVQLLDPYVSPHHARLDWGEGNASIVDLDSRNGVIDPVTRSRVRTLALPSGAVAQVGHTRLRVFSEQHPVAEALPLRPAHRVLALIEHPSVAWATIVVGALLLLLRSWLTTASLDGVATAAGVTGAAMLMLALWAGIWAFATRVFVGRSQFASHLAIATAAVVLVSLLSYALDVPRFLWPLDWFWGFAESVATVVIVSAAVAMELVLVGALSSRRRRVGAVVVALVVYALLNVGSLSRLGEFDDSLSFDSTLLPLSPRVLHRVTLDRFFSDTRALQAEVDSMRTVGR